MENWNLTISWAVSFHLWQRQPCRFETQVDDLNAVVFDPRPVHLLLFQTFIYTLGGQQQKNRKFNLTFWECDSRLNATRKRLGPFRTSTVGGEMAEWSKVLFQLTVSLVGSVKNRSALHSAGHVPRFEVSQRGWSQSSFSTSFKFTRFAMKSGISGT